MEGVSVTSVFRLLPSLVAKLSLPFSGRNFLGVEDVEVCESSHWYASNDSLFGAEVICGAAEADFCATSDSGDASDANETPSSTREGTFSGAEKTPSSVSDA